MEHAIKEQMVKAYWDMFIMELQAEPKKFDMLCVIIQDIKNRLCSLTPHRIDLQNEICESLDTDWLLEMLSTNSMDPKHVIQLIMFIIFKLKQYSAPNEDSLLSKWESSVRELQTIEYATFLPKFFQDCYRFLDIIDKQLDDFRSTYGTS